MKKIAIIVTIIACVFWVITYILEKMEMNPYRYFSNSSEQAQKNSVLIGKYQLLNSNSFFKIKDAWLEKQTTYMDDSKTQVDSTKYCFLISLDTNDKKNNLKNFTKDWLIEADSTLGGYYGSGVHSHLIFFHEVSLSDSITVKLLSNPEQKVINELIFVRQK